MRFTSSIFGLLLALAASAQASVHARSGATEPSVVFFDDVKYIGASYSPPELIPAVCNTLPGNWLDRSQSVRIGWGYTCAFFTAPGCEGEKIPLFGNVEDLPPRLYNGIESFLCTKWD